MTPLVDLSDEWQLQHAGVVEEEEWSWMRWRRPAGDSFNETVHRRKLTDSEDISLSIIYLSVSVFLCITPSILYVLLLPLLLLLLLLLLPLLLLPLLLPLLPPLLPPLLLPPLLPPLSLRLLPPFYHHHNHSLHHNYRRPLVS